MDWIRDVPDSLSKAQLSLERIENFLLLKTFRWNDEASRWIINFRISLTEIDNGHFPKHTDWYLAADESYPRGRIDIYPAKEGGISDTFPHQSFNYEGNNKLPWREGKICVNTQANIIGRHGYDIEPYTIEDRLFWHCQRAVAWSLAASKDELVIPGEPFELPLIPPRSLIKEQESKELYKLLFSEGPIDISPWTGITANTGRARCFNLNTDKRRWFLEWLIGPKNELLLQVSWGKHVTSSRGTTWDGIWLKLSAMPLVKPYRFPLTWGELSKSLFERGVSMTKILGHLSNNIRDGKAHFLLIGFPIPAVISGQPVMMHWISISLPVLSRNRQYPAGFRPNNRGYFENDMRTRFRDDNALTYILTDNWHLDQIQNRGRFREEFRAFRIVIIGCGALGSSIAEMFVRGGVNHITIIDDERVEIGNLARHTLSLKDLENNKASQLMLHLNSLNPHAEVSYVPSKIIIGETDILKQLGGHDLIIDCTGNDDVLHALSLTTLPLPIHYVSLSIGFRAKRMFFFHALDVSFPIIDYIEEINPWLEAEENEFKDDEFPREGIGCYHPVFPARCDDIWLWSSVAVKAILRLIDDSVHVESTLHVYEQIEEDGSVSVHRAIEVPEFE